MSEEAPDRGEAARRADVGQTLYTAGDDPVGTVRGVEEDGVFVSVRDGVASFSVEHVRAGHAFGEAELVWRCTECGEVGDLKRDLPELRRRARGADVLDGGQTGSTTRRFPAFYGRSGTVSGA